MLSPALGPVALAIVRREGEPGTTVAVGDGNRAEIVELPLLRDPDSELSRLLARDAVGVG